MKSPVRSSAFRRFVHPAVTLTIIIATCLAGLSCGYRFAGGGNLPGGIQQVSVDMFENPAGESGLEALLTDALISSLTRNHIKLIPKEDADACFHGVITSVSTETIAHTAQNIAGERRVTVSVSLKLKRPDETLIRSLNNISDNETYAVSEDRLHTEANRQKALSGLSERLADDLVLRLSDDF